MRLVGKAKVATKLLIPECALTNHRTVVTATNKLPINVISPFGPNTESINKQLLNSTSHFVNSHFITKSYLSTSSSCLR